jgi:hypothetical protein
VGQYQGVLEDLLEVVNANKSLPPANHSVGHRNVTTGPLITSKFRRVDSRNMAAAKWS